MSTQAGAAHGGPAADRAGVQVHLNDLQRRYGELRALDGLSLEIGAGELVALLGPSGCGKTTALRSLAGLERLDGGSILLDGHDITQLPANRRNMGVVFQAYSLFPHMTARENVAFGLRLRRIGRAERLRTADRFIELVHLSNRADRYPHQLSGGQQQRVALARALAISPQLLLLDEPLSALDAKVRAQLRDEIRRIQLEVRITTLFVTHDQDEALAMADRVAVMHGGQLEQIATPTELYERPRTARVAEFVGLSNRLTGEARDGVATVLGARIPLLEGSATGSAVTVLVRPEAVEVSRDAGGTGRVVSASFLGPIGRVQVRLDDGTLVLAQVASADITGFAHAEPVRVTLKPVPALAIRA
jgi:putative spermidine/putrescine transport system ATP-binding protein